MSHIANGKRTFVADQQEYAYKIRPFLGLQNSAVLERDDLTYVAYAGETAAAVLVDAESKVNGKGEMIDTLPTDFRICGIQELTARGVPVEDQVRMLGHFMRDFTKEQRAEKIAAYDAAKNDPEQVTAFCLQMLALLNY